MAVLIYSSSQQFWNKQFFSLFYQMKKDFLARPITSCGHVGGIPFVADELAV